MALSEHRKNDLISIRDRFVAVADSLDELIKEMESAGCESIEFQSESVLNHRLVPLEDWIYRVRGIAKKRLRKFQEEQAAFRLGQQYAASKAAAEKPAKSPGKRKK